MSNMRALSENVVVDIDSARVAGENRAHSRHLTILRVAKFVCDGREGLGVVRNLSAGGMKIDSYMPVKVDDRVQVSLADGQHLDAVVVWQEGESVGIKFDRQASVEQLLAIPVGTRRGKVARPPRVNAGRSAILRVSELAVKIPKKVEIADISQRGAKILTSAVLTVNEDVSLQLSGLPPIDATVRWVQPGAVGLAFHDVLAVKPLMKWLSGEPD